MSILVFGKTGQVASELSKFPSVVCLSRAEADLSVSGSCRDAIEKRRPSLIINAAAYTAVDRAEEEAEVAQKINGDAVGEIGLTAAKHQIPVVHFSTDYVFDGSKDTPWRPSDLPSPLGVYGATKLSGEEKLRSSNATYAIVRTSWVFSSSGANFLKTMIKLSESRESLSVVSDQLGGPTPAEALATAALSIGNQLIEDPEKKGTYHFSGMPTVSWADFARTIFLAIGRDTNVADILTQDYPTPARRPQNSILDCTSMMTTFGLSQPDWREGLNSALSELGFNTVETNDDHSQSASQKKAQDTFGTGLWEIPDQQITVLASNAKLVAEVTSSASWTITSVVQQHYADEGSNYLPYGFEGYHDILRSLRVLREASTTVDGTDLEQALRSEIEKLNQEITKLQNQLSDREGLISEFSKSYAQNLGKTLASPWAFGALALLITNFFGVGIGDLTLERLREAFDNLREK